MRRKGTLVGAEVEIEGREKEVEVGWLVEELVEENG